MIPKEILKKIRQIEIRTSRLVNDIFAGEYESIFKGRGMEFHEVREYYPGDDIRSIDWNVTARTGNAFVKKFLEERELTVILAVDISRSGHFGTKKNLKSELTAEIAALLAFSAIRNNDKVGLLLFTDKKEKFIPPKKGRKHALRVIRDILYFKPESKKTDIKSALDYLGSVLKKKAIVFLISDYLDKGYENVLRVLNKRHDMVGISIYDEKEKDLPKTGLMAMEDAESGDMVYVDTSDTSFRDKFKKMNQEAISERKRVFSSIKMDMIELSTDKSYVEPLILFFKKRAKRRR